MGLDFSHTSARWSYSGFGQFRRRLWNVSGFPGDLYNLYETKGHFIAEDHPLFALFNHSDCDGELTPAELEEIIPELERLGPLLGDDYDVRTCARLVEGMKLALFRNESLQFR